LKGSLKSGVKSHNKMREYLCAFDKHIEPY